MNKYPKNIKRRLGPPDFYHDTIFEGSQGLLLDQHHGFFPNVTRANVGLENVESFTGLNDIYEVYLVTRAYQTRHGNGFMTNENRPHNITENIEETNKEHEYQGKFRRSSRKCSSKNFLKISLKFLPRNM